MGWNTRLENAHWVPTFPKAKYVMADRELGMRADYDSRQAGQTRRNVFDRFCDTSTVMCVVHFPSPSTGRVRRRGNGYKFVS